jgi:hypothetical protein
MEFPISCRDPALRIGVSDGGLTSIPAGSTIPESDRVTPQVNPRDSPASSASNPALRLELPCLASNPALRLELPCLASNPALRLESLYLAANSPLCLELPCLDEGCRAPQAIALERSPKRVLVVFRYVECYWSALRLPDSRVFEC